MRHSLICALLVLAPLAIQAQSSSPTVAPLLVASSAPVSNDTASDATATDAIVTDSQSPTTSATTAPAAPVTATPPALDQSFMHKLGRAYVADWAGNGPSTAVPQSPRRGTPAPIPSPPYPATDWPIGGTPVIGSPDGQTYPLMQALNENKGVNKIYGWVEVGGNGSTNNKTNASKGIAANAPAAYDV